MTPLYGVIMGGMATFRLFVIRDMAAYQIHPSQTRCDAGPALPHAELVSWRMFTIPNL